MKGDQLYLKHILNAVELPMANAEIANNDR
jgi:hypothetical protein